MEISESVRNKTISRIIDFIGLYAESRLTVAVPKEGSFPGIDLIIKKRGEYKLEEEEKPQEIIRARIFGARKKKKSKEILIIVNIQERKSKDTIFQKEIDIKNFKDIGNIYLIFIFFDVLKQDIEDYLCVLSLDQFKNKAKKTSKEDVFLFESFISPEKKDDYSEFLINKRDLSRFFLNIIFPSQF